MKNKGGLILYKGQQGPLAWMDITLSFTRQLGELWVSNFLPQVKY